MCPDAEWSSVTNERDEFITEVSELLENAEQALLQMDRMPEEQCGATHYDQIFRALHNIKGTAGMMEWTDLQHHVHQVETVLMKYKDGKSIPRNLIGWFLRAVDATRTIMGGGKPEFNYDPASGRANPGFSTPEQQIAKSAPVEKVPDEFYSEVREALDRFVQGLLKIEKESPSGMALTPIVDALYRDIHSVKGAAQLFGFDLAAKITHTMESSLEVYRTGSVGTIDPGLVNTLIMSVDIVHHAIKVPAGDALAKEVEFNCAVLDGFQSASPSISSESTSPAIPPPVVQPLVNTSPVAPVLELDKADSTIRVQVSLLDRLMTLMGEMVLVRNQVLQYSNRSDDLEFLNLSQRLDVVTSELQEETMKTRMQPIGNILTKFQRVVRDLSGTLNKKITLQLSGVETELDKSLIEAIKDPLTHIVRNSCDHGIELPDVRSQAGKPDGGTVSIRSFHEGGQVIVEVSDDGRGLHREKLIAKALEKGILTPDRAKTISDRDAYSLIFAPGLSTAENVTNVSGRGVGMDVVKSNIEKIGGVVEITSQPGQGTKITLKIPLTLAIVPAMIVRANGDRYAIPQVKLVELVRVDRNSVEQLQGKPVYILRGNILPLLNLKESFEMLEEGEVPEAINIVVLNAENFLFGMIVDEVLDTADIVVKPLARFLKGVATFSGATVLGDGSVALILDVIGIAQKYLGATGEAQQNLAEPGKGISESMKAVASPVREFVIARAGEGAKVAIPLDSVSRMEEFPGTAIERSGNQSIIRYRGAALPLLSLGGLLKQGIRGESKFEKETIHVIVARQDHQVVGLVVEEIIDVLKTSDIVDSSVRDHAIIEGNLITKDEIIVVIDLEKVFESLIPGHPARSLPRDASAVPAALNVASSGSRRRVLLVEDSISIRNSVKASLERAGFEVHIGENGEDGLKRLTELRFEIDLVISDIEMPIMNGFEFALRFRKLPKMQHIPLIAFTTKVGESCIKEAGALGFDAYIEKANAEQLIQMVQSCIGRNRKVA